jgi:hypothetical protein
MKSVQELRIQFANSLASYTGPESFNLLRNEIRESERAEMAKGFLGADHKVLTDLRGLLRMMDDRDTGDDCYEEGMM